MREMSEQLSIAVFLALQGMIWWMAAEVAVRYTVWYFRTANDEGLVMRSLILGIALTHIAICGNATVWIHERLTDPLVVDGLMEQLRISYGLSAIFRTLLFIGVSIHLIPIWRIQFRFSYGRVLTEILLRASISCAVYFFLLWKAGVLSCYINIGCSLP